jgi:hypothetical protein
MSRSWLITIEKKKNQQDWREKLFTCAGYRISKIYEISSAHVR